jgi:predicted dienelactone hydrolase
VPVPSSTSSTQTETPGVVTRTLDITDPSRKTGDEPGRHLPTTLYYPEDPAGPLPLVVFSHGLDGDPAGFRFLLQNWAAAGFIVAAPKFPLTSHGSAGVVDDVLNQPADVSYVLSSVLELNTAPGEELAGRIDADHIAAAGHSLGAITTLGLLFTCCHDPRITAAVVLAGEAYELPLAYAEPPVPVLFMHGTQDDTVPFRNGQQAYAAAAGPKAFVELIDGTHSGPYVDPAEPYYPVVRSVTTDFLVWALTGDDAAVGRLRADASVPGVADLIDDDL